MKNFLTFLCLFISVASFSQKKGFEFLSSGKTSLESVIKTYASSIPDSSETFKKYYVALSRNYNKAKASYNGYRGAMKDCILNNDNKRKIQQCLRTKSVDIEGRLDTLDMILEQAYLEAYFKSGGQTIPSTTSGKNSGFFTGDMIKELIDSLINGTVKLWGESKKFKKQYKDDYLNNIASKEYDLSDLDELIKQKGSISPAK